MAYDAARAQAAIAAIESGGRYNAKGPLTGGDRAYGKYQVMGNNIPAWSQQVLGYAMTPDQFLASPEAQDAVFDGIFGNYVNNYGPANAASLWFTGSMAKAGANKRDVYGTTGKGYVAQFVRHYTGKGPIPNVEDRPLKRATIAQGTTQQGTQANAPDWVRPGDVFRPANFDAKAGGSRYGYAISADGRTSYYRTDSGKIITTQRDGPPPVQRPTAVSPVHTAPTAPTLAVPAPKAAVAPQTLLAEAAKLPPGPLNIGPLIAASASGDKARIATATKGVQDAWNQTSFFAKLGMPGQMSAYAETIATSAPHVFQALKTDPTIRSQIPKDYAGQIDTALNSVKNFKPPADETIAVPVKGKDRDQSVADLQAMLGGYGFDPGPIDGLWGPRTFSAAEQAARSQAIVNPNHKASLAAALRARDIKLQQAYAPLPSQGGTAAFAAPVPTRAGLTPAPTTGGSYQPASFPQSSSSYSPAAVTSPAGGARAASGLQSYTPTLLNSYTASAVPTRNTTIAGSTSGPGHGF